MEAGGTKRVVTRYSGRAICGGVRFFHGPRADRSHPTRGVELDELGVAVGHHREGEPRRATSNIQGHHTTMVRTNRIGPIERLRGPSATDGVAVPFTFGDTPTSFPRHS